MFEYMYVSYSIFSEKRNDERNRLKRKTLKKKMEEKDGALHRLCAVLCTMHMPSEKLYMYAHSVQLALLYTATVGPTCNELGCNDIPLITT